MRKLTYIKLVGLLSFFSITAFAVTKFPSLVTNNFNLTTATGSTVSTFDSGKNLVSSGVTDTTLALLNTGLGIANGGTNNAALAVTAGGVVYTDGTKLMNSGAGTSGYIFTSNGASAPTWQVNAAAPPGMVIMFVGSSCPTGYLAMDGSTVSRATYAALYAVQADTYGAGNGTTTFTLPDARGVFIRGSGSQTISATTYTGTRGTSQRDQFQSHTHTLIAGQSTSILPYQAIMNSTNGSAVTVTPTSPVDDGVGGTSRAGTETRPANIVLLYCIKT